MTQINEFNISEDELKEIEDIKELAQGCTDYFLNSLIDPENGEKIQLGEEEKGYIFKLVLYKTIDYIERNSFPNDEKSFEQYVESVFSYIQEQL